MDLAEKCKEWWPRMCLVGRLHTESLTAAEIYNGVTRPDLWIGVHALVADEAGTDTAKQLLVDVIKDAAALLGDGPAKERILELELADDEAKVASNIEWARLRKKAGVETHLEHAYLEALIWFGQPGKPKSIQIPFAHVVHFRTEAEGISLTDARTNIYEFMRGLLDEATFKGMYT